MGSAQQCIDEIKLESSPEDVDVKESSLAWTATETPDGKTYLNGPDQILPSEAVCAWSARGATRIRLGTGKMENEAPISVPSLLKRCADRSPDRIALRVKREGGVWQSWTYREYLSDARTTAKAFIALGLERYHAVCILGFNSPEWFLSNMGAIFAGGLSAGVYTTNGPDSCAYVAQDSRANIFVVEDSAQLAKILLIRHQLPHLKAIVQYTGQPTEAGVLSWSDLMNLGRHASDAALDSRLRTLAINQACALIYTSGTTGPPKGVMLSHDNVTWMAHVNRAWCGLRDASDTYQEEIISYLPLSHVAAQCLDVYVPLATCAAVHFADKDALKGTLGATMKAVRPSIFLAVPRVWEKLQDRIVESGAGARGLKRLLVDWAKKKGLEYNMKKMESAGAGQHADADAYSYAFAIANSLVLSKVHTALGLTRNILTLSGAAPIAPDILKFFMSLNILITEVFGMSECSGPHTMGVASSFRLGSVGRTMDGCTTRIRTPDVDGNGEVLIAGRHVCMGYLHQEAKTKAAIDEEGWLHSEDIGRVDDDGYLYITGRIKELIITAGGENVAPVPIEDWIKGELPCVSQVVLIGDRRRFLSVLLTLKTEVDGNTQEPLDELTNGCQEWMRKNAGCSVGTVAQVLQELYGKLNPRLTTAIQAGIDRCNSQAPSQAQKVQKWVILPKDFSIPGGELGPTLKLKRSVVHDKYSDEIGNIYNEIQSTNL